MNTRQRLAQIEKTLRGRDCDACAAREKQIATATNDDEWLSLFFAQCPRCDSRRKWLDLLALAEPVATE